MAAASTISARVRVYGRVQGVWFRAWTAEQARSLGLDGWVRNRADGSVEAAFRGAEASVREMVARCRRGPPAARVARVDEIPETEPVPDGFAELPTE